MKILSAADSIFKRAAQHEPWFPDPEFSPYDTDDEWQRAHLWDHHTETGNTFGPYRGPSILHHPDLQYALDNGWRVHGGDRMIDHQTRGETGSGNTYLYKRDPQGLMHSVNLGLGPDDTNLFDEDHAGDKFDEMYGTAPEGNYRHLLSSEGNTAEGPVGHDTLSDLVDDEKRRSAEPDGYKDFAPLPSYRGRRSQSDIDFDKRYNHAVQRAWETGTNDYTQHMNDPMPDAAAMVDEIPRGGGRAPVSVEDEGPDDLPMVKHPRYGSNDE